MKYNRKDVKNDIYDLNMSIYYCKYIFYSDDNSGDDIMFFRASNRKFKNIHDDKNVLLHIRGEE